MKTPIDLVRDSGPGFYASSDYIDGWSNALDQLEDYYDPFTWKKGAPSNTGDYWLTLHDQGGYPFVMHGKVYNKILGSPSPEELISGSLETEFYISIPGLLSQDKPLSDVWNIDAYAEYSAPKPYGT